MSWQASSVRSFGIAERVGSVEAVLGEGPRWDAEAGRLLWVDIEGGLLHAGDSAIEGGAMVCAVAPWAGDTVLVALADALAAVDVGDGSVRRLVDIPHGRPGMRCNDGACDPPDGSGSARWRSTRGRARGRSTATTSTARSTRCSTASRCPTGSRWDAAERLMYYVDSPTQRIDVFDFDVASGALANRRPFAVIPEADGIPTASRSTTRAGSGWRCTAAVRCAGSTRTAACRDAWRCPCPRSPRAASPGTACS